MRRIRTFINSLPSFVVALLLTVSASALAGTLVDQGSPGNQGPWPVTVKPFPDGGGIIPVYPITYPDGGDIPVNPAAHTTGASDEVLCLTSYPDGGHTTLVGGLSGRRYILVQNNGPNPINLRVGSSNSVAAKSVKLKPASGTTPGGFWAGDISDLIPVYCSSQTADQVTGAATNYQEAK